MWSPDTYLEKLYCSVTPIYRFEAQNLAEWRIWRNEFRPQLISILGGFPAMPAPLGENLIEEVECVGYLKQRVEFTTYVGLVMPARKTD